MSYVCTRCKAAKPLTEMSKQSSRRDGLHGWCKSCMNERARSRKSVPAHVRGWNLKSRYGITDEQAKAILAEQGGECAICRTVPTRPVIDHDHATGIVRGILCHACNIKLHALDKWPHFVSAMQYLRRHK